MENTLVNEDGFESSPKFNHKFFHPSRHVPPLLDPNMSPVIGDFLCNKVNVKCASNHTNSRLQ